CQSHLGCEVGIGIGILPLGRERDLMDRKSRYRKRVRSQCRIAARQHRDSEHQDSLAMQHGILLLTTWHRCTALRRGTHLVGGEWTKTVDCKERILGRFAARESRRFRMNRAFSTVLTRMGLVVSVILLPGESLADEVQLVNGDVLSAIVVSLDAKQIKLKSELLGDLTIDRAKVRQITLGERAKPALAATQHAPASSSLPLSDLLKDLLKM